MATLPKNAHVSTHPCLKAKLSLLRSVGTSSRDVQTLVHEIALMVGYEALASGLKAKDNGTVCSYSNYLSLWLPTIVSALVAD
jgi:uracil phosphoribosyltransferase